MEEYVSYVHDQHCTIILQPEALQHLHVHQFILDGCDYVCIHCGLLSDVLNLQHSMSYNS